MNSRLKKIAFINMLLCAILIAIINILAYHSALGILVNIVLIPFYKYSWDTKYFIKNKEDTDGGFSDNALYDYPGNDIAIFDIYKCKKDTTKLVGRFHFYGNGGLISGKREIDTLIYYCK